MQKKRLLILHPIIGPYRIDFFNALAEHFDIKCCFFMRKFPSIKYDMSKMEKQLKCAPVYLDVYKFGKIGIPKGFFRILEDFSPDYVMLSECSIRPLLVLIYKILLRKKYKTITLIDDSYDMAVEGNDYSIGHMLGKKVVIPLSNEIITVEPRVRDFFAHKYKKGLFFPIVSDEKRLRDMYERALPLSRSLIERHDLHKKKIILFVGRLIKEKNIDKTIEAFLKAKVKDSVFVIVGDGVEMDRLKEMAVDATNVMFTGMLEGLDLYAWYNIATIHILASKAEPFGAVTNEALIGGCNSIVSKKAGSQCLIEEGVNGFLIDPEDVEDITRVISKSFEMFGDERISGDKLRPSKMVSSFDSYISDLVKGLLNIR